MNWKHYFRTLFGTMFEITLFTMGIFLYANNERFSCLWFLGVLNITIVVSIMYFINWSFISNEDKSGGKGK